MRTRNIFTKFHMGGSSAPVRLQQHTRLLINTMPTTQAASPPIKVLMLHGFTQSGPLFQAKTKVLEKHLAKVFPSIELHYPTGPIRLKPSDIPGLDLSKFEGDADDIPAYAWWRRSDTSDPVEYMALEDGLRTVADTLQSQGPFDGVMGFSQGAALAAMVASLLEGDTRREAFDLARDKSKFGIQFSDSFDQLEHPPLKFCVVYSGFVAPGERYRGFYENPHIQTPMCHVIGSLDSVVEESRTNLLVAAAGGEDKTQIVMHPGGHFVPTSKQYLDAIATFVRTNTARQTLDQPSKEERVEDMDVPF